MKNLEILQSSFPNKISLILLHPKKQKKWYELTISIRKEIYVKDQKIQQKEAREELH